VIVLAPVIVSIYALVALPCEDAVRLWRGSEEGRLSVAAVLAGNLNSSHGTGVILMGHSSAGRADTAGS